MEEKELTEIKERSARNKKKVIIICICLVAALVFCAVLIAILESAEKGGEDEFYTLPPVDILKLHETYPEDFDIMEYEEYLNLDRNIYRNDPQYGIKLSLTREQAVDYGKAFIVMYDVLVAINEGDCDTYNSYMGDGRLEKDEFTQQQIYDIEIVPYSESEEGALEEYIFKVTYKIHENNGSYRDTIESDVSRPVYFYIDNQSGDFKVMKIVEQGYKK